MAFLLAFSGGVLGDESMQGFVDRMHGLIDEREFDVAGAEAEDLLVASGENGSSVEATAALLVLGTIELSRERFAAAIQHFLACRDYPENGFRDDCTNRLAEAYWRLGALSEAAGYMVELGERQAESGDLQQLARVWNNLAIIHAEMGELERAEEYFFKGLDTVVELGDGSLEAGAWSNLAKLSHLRGNLDEAMERINRAMALGAEHGGPERLSSIFHVLGSIRIDRGEYDQALGDFSTAMAYAEEAGLSGEAANSRIEVGRALIEMGQPEEAVEILSDALSVVEDIGLLGYQLNIHELLQDAYEQVGDHALALEHARNFITAQQEMLSEEQQRDVRRMDTLFRVSQSERRAEAAAAEAALSQTRLGQQRAWIAALILAIALVLVVTGAIVLRVRHRQRLEHELYTRELRFKQDFSTMLVHDLHGPVQEIRKSASRVSERTDDPAIRNLSDQIQNYCEGMSALVGDLLNLAQSEGEALKLDRRSTYMKAVVERAIEAVRPMADQKQVGLELTGESLPAVPVDAARMEQVMENLLDNAIRFSPSGGQVLVELTRKGSAGGRFMQFVRVMDQGEGISRKSLESIFKSYATDSGKERRKGGNGLGLTVSRMIVRTHGRRTDCRQSQGRVRGGVGDSVA
jgi:signal transduction histidine kinase